MPGYEDEEPEVYYDFDLCHPDEDEDIISLDEVDEEPGLDPLRNADWTGLTDDFDGESLIDNLLSGDTE